jgi:hypothetical protein
MKLNFEIAANAKGITLGKYIDYQNAVDNIEKVRVITGKSTESIRLLQLHVIDEIIEQFEAAIRLTSQDFERTVRVGTYELGFIPDLSAMSFGEYVDLDTTCTNIYKDGTIMGEAAHKMMSILYRPIVAKFGKYYDIEAYKTNDKRKYENAISELTLDHVLNTLLFFSTLELELYNDSLVYLAKEITEIVKEMKEQQPQTA